MATPVRYDDQYCPIARAMDVLGDRWTLLVLRELMLGEQRFSELRSHLPGIAATVLTDRLRALADEGLVEAVPSDAPRRSAYALTRRGRDVIPVLAALSRFGFPLLEPPDDDTVIRPELAVRAAIAAYYDAEAAHGVDERYRFVIDGDEVTLSSVRGGGSRKDPILVFESDAEVWMRIRQGRTSLAKAIERGEIRVTGPRSALTDFRKVFRLKR